MRTRLVFFLVVVLLGLPTATAVADDGAPPPPAGTETPATPAPETSPSETPSDQETADDNSPEPTKPTDPEPTKTTDPEPSPSEQPSTTSQRRSAPTTTQTQNTPAATVSITASTAGTSAVGRTSNVWGTATNAPNSEVWTEVKIGSNWSRSQTRKTTGSGSYVIPLTYGMNSGGTQSFRVAVRGSDNKITRSRTVTLTRVAVSATNAPTTRVGVNANVWGRATAAPNATVWTEARLPNGTWSRSATGKTGSNGSYVLPLSYGQNSAGYKVFRVGVSSKVGTVYSNPIGITRVTISTYTAGNAKVGTGANVWGTAQAAPNARIRTEVRLSNGSWSTSQVSTTNRYGAYTMPLTYGQNASGNYTFRVVATVNGVDVYSSPFTFTRYKATNLDSRCLTGRVMCASKKDRKLYWVINGQIQKTMDARFGCPATPSDNGSFRVFWKSYNHTSTIYGTWMPRAMFYNGGEAVHFSQDFQARGWAGCSGGCVNIRDWDGINWLYNQVRDGDKVVVY